MVKQSVRQTGGIWDNPPPTLEEVMRDIGQEEVVAYVVRQQNMVEHYIMTRPILDLCTEAERWPGAQVYKQWWYQEAIDILGAQEAAIYSEGGEGGKEDRKTMSD